MSTEPMFVDDAEAVLRERAAGFEGDNDDLQAASGTVLDELARLRAELDEARRERSGMQHLAQKNRTALDMARAALARRDTTIAAALGKCDETAALAFQAAHGNQMHTTTMYSVTASIRTSTIRELLSASDETDPRADCGCCDGSWRLCRGLVDKGMARCCADCTHDLSAPVEAGTPAAEPAPDDLLGRLQRSLSPLAGADDTAREAQP